MIDNNLLQAEVFMRKPFLVILILSLPALFFSTIIQYSWQPTSSEYRVQISTNENFYNPVIDAHGTTNNYIVDLESGRY